MVLLLCVKLPNLKQEISKMRNNLFFFGTINLKNSVNEAERFLHGKNSLCVLFENKYDLLNQNQVNYVLSL